MKNVYKKLIPIVIISLFVILIFYFFNLMKTAINIANENIETTISIKSEVNKTKKDYENYNVSDKILKSDLFKKFNDYDFSDLINKGKEEIFYKNNN